MSGIKTKGVVRLRLSNIMDDRKMTQIEMSRISGLSRNSISVLSRHPQQISMDTIAAICDALKIRPEELFDYHPLEELH